VRVKEGGSGKEEGQKEKRTYLRNSKIRLVGFIIQYLTCYSFVDIFNITIREVVQCSHNR
jgi:hypothetical protein